MEMLISLSILEYEPELSKNINSLENTKAFLEIMKLIETGEIHDIHIDVMRPPMIPNKNKFSIPLIRKLYEELCGKIPITLHLMVNDPFEIVNEANKFIEGKNRTEVTIIIQVESFNSENETIKAIKTIKEYGYKVGVCLNLPTPKDRLTDAIASNADIILFMTVPMGAGGQKFHEESIPRIREFFERFPNKIIKVDGGINPDTIIKVWKAGARISVVGSYITASEDPVKSLLNLKKVLQTYTKD